MRTTYETGLWYIPLESNIPFSIYINICPQWWLKSRFKKQQQNEFEVKSPISVILNTCSIFFSNYCRKI